MKMSEKIEICSVCGNKVPQGTETCNVCGSPVHGRLAEGKLTSSPNKQKAELIISPPDVHGSEKSISQVVSTTKVKTCHVCGNEIQADADICEFCGSLLGNPTGRVPKKRTKKLHSGGAPSPGIPKTKHSHASTHKPVSSKTSAKASGGRTFKPKHHHSPAKSRASKSRIRSSKFPRNGEWRIVLLAAVIPLLCLLTWFVYYNYDAAQKVAAERQLQEELAREEKATELVAERQRQEQLARKKKIAEAAAERQRQEQLARKKKIAEDRRQEQLARKKKAAGATASKAIKEAFAKFANAKNTSYSDVRRLSYCKSVLAHLSYLTDYSDLLSPAHKQQIANLKAEIAKLAKTLNPAGPQKGSEWTVPDLGMQFVYVKEGTFQMGSNNGSSDEKPVHRVAISKPFWIGKYEVTNREYRAFLNASGYNGSTYADSNYLKHIKGNSNMPTGDNYPICWISWKNAVAFCKWLTEREREAGRLPLGYEYRLPTEAEWEYAARGGSGDRGYKYSGSDNIASVAWYIRNSDSKTHPVGEKKANELGVYDMSGNVWEWCSDKWHSNYSGAPADGSSWGTGSSSYRVLRGGSWSSIASHCQLTDRGINSPRSAKNVMGVRICIACSP